MEPQQLHGVVLRAARTHHWQTPNGLVRRRISSIELAACSAQCGQDEAGWCRACYLDRSPCCWARGPWNRGQLLIARVALVGSDRRLFAPLRAELHWITCLAGPESESPDLDREPCAVAVQRREALHDRWIVAGGQSSPAWRSAHGAFHIPRTDQPGRSARMNWRLPSALATYRRVHIHIRVRNVRSSACRRGRSGGSTSRQQRAGPGHRPQATPDHHRKLGVWLWRLRLSPGH